MLLLEGKVEARVEARGNLGAEPQIDSLSTQRDRPAIVDTGFGGAKGF
jgi:hypothetical protein